MLCSLYFLYFFGNFNYFFKKIYDYKSIYLLTAIIIITLLIPGSIGVAFGLGALGYTGTFKLGVVSIFILWFFPGLCLGCIPLGILTMKEDLSSSKEIQQMEQEKLEHEQWIEKQLLSEQITRMKQDERNKQNLGNDEK